MNLQKIIADILLNYLTDQQLAEIIGISEAEFINKIRSNSFSNIETQKIIIIHFWLFIKMGTQETTLKEIKEGVDLYINSYFKP